MAAAKKSAARKKKTPSGKQLVIVESPAKAKTISKFLGEDFEVLASIGHVRDLPKARTDLKPSEQDHKYAKLGVDVENDFQPLYCVPPGKRDQIKLLRQSMKDAPALWLATDEDREGESISWHLLEVLNPKVPVHRLVFHEITRSAIMEALASPREIDTDLVQAQESRRILDRLYGYEVSPVLWRKIRRGLSAGRVQSVALRLLVDREIDRIKFESSEYWDIDGLFETAGAEALEARLRRIGEKRIAAGRDFDPDTGKLQKEGVVVLDEKSAKELAARLKPQKALVKKVEEKPYQEKPAAPFTTSTLQQEAGRKLRFAARRTMSIAQQLYENGLITYMRTDSTALSDQAVHAAREVIGRKYGGEFLPEGPRIYKTKVKNAQEAHEAIRPAGSSFAPIAVVKQQLGKDAARLYEMIWKRTVASQMVNARGKRISVRLAIEEARFTTSGKTIEFPGFRRAYVEGSDDPDAELADQERILPPLEPGQELVVKDLEPKGHTTQPPARYTEASLVKMLDKRGIGRPSTWASIIQVLLDREYAFRKGSALVPSYTAFAVVRLLREHFGNLLDYGFTASMEDDLDSISRGEMDRVEYLRRFYNGNGDAGLTTLVEQGMEEVDPRKVCAFKLGETEDGRVIEVRVGKFGLFVSDGDQNASLREDTVPDELTLAHAVEMIEAAARGPVALGEDPETKKPVYVKTGRFGPYVQLGDADPDDKKAPKPKMVSLLDGMEPETLDLATALRLLELPRDLGEHPEQQEGASEKEHVFAHLGRYGPYVKWGKESRSIPSDVSILDIDLPRAVALLKEPRRRRGRQPAKPLRVLGPHPESGDELKILNGRFGPYVTDGTVNASLPKSIEPEELSIPEALELLARRIERLKAKKAAKRSKKKAGKKKAAKKKAAKKKAKKKARKKAKRKAAAKKAAAAKKPASDGDAPPA